MPSYVLPQVLVFQEFLRAQTATAQPLRACILGEQFDLHRYSEPTEKDDILVAENYDPSAEACYDFPGRQAGGIVDPSYTKVFIDDALLKYYEDASGDGAETKYTTPGLNRVRSDTVVWKTANGTDRDDSLLRDVQVGDVVKLTAVACGETFTFQSSVIGLLAEVVDADIDTAAADASNAAAQSASTSTALVAGTTNSVKLLNGDVDATTYNGLPTGDINEVYTIEVVAGGGTDQAQLRITSQSGNDDVGVVTFDVEFAEAFAIGTRGLTVEFSLGAPVAAVTNDVFLVGQIWTVTVAQVYVKLVGTSGGTYVGEVDTTYIVEVTRGGKTGAAEDVDKPQISCTTTTGVDVSGPTIVAGATDVGTQGVTLSIAQTNLNKGDRFTIGVTAESDGAIQTLLLAHNLPAAMRGDCTEVDEGSSDSLPFPDLSIALYIKKDITVPEFGASAFVNWTQNDTEVCLQSGVESYDSSWTLSGVQQPLPVEGGSIYIEHRDRVVDAPTLGTISDVSEIPTLFPSGAAVHPDNPLVFGVFKALTNSNGQEVKYLNIVSGTDEATLVLGDWLEALDHLTGTDSTYGLVPLTQDKDVLDAVLAHCDAMSAPETGRWRICWLNRPAVEVEPIYTETADEDPLLATILDDEDASGTQYTIVEVEDGEFMTKGVRAKDTLRAGYTTDGFGNTVYSSYLIDAVINEETLRLIKGPSLPVNTAAKVEIHRTLTKNELATNLATYPGLFASRRANLVWPDRVGNAGLTFDGYFLCAGLAGLRSGVLPHQGLTNVELQGFDDLTRTTKFFSATQLNIMAASGYWIVTQDIDGTVFSRHQLTCGDQTDVNQRENSVTTNLDSISFAYLNTLKVYIGKGNVSPGMVDIIHGEVLSLIYGFKNTINNTLLGPQVIDAKILELAQHATFKDRIVIRVLNTLPAPFNNAETHLIVQ